jgi:hypothetical protein
MLEVIQEAQAPHPCIEDTTRKKTTFIPINKRCFLAIFLSFILSPPPSASMNQYISDVLSGFEKPKKKQRKIIWREIRGRKKLY